MNKPLDENLDALTQRLLDSYASDGQMHRIGEINLPSRTRIVELLEEVRQLLFPGYFGHKKLTWDNARYYVGTLLSRVAEDLTDQIRLCMCLGRACGVDHAAGCPQVPACHDLAAAKTAEFIQQLPDLREMLALDAQAAYDGDPAAKSIEEIIYSYPGFYAVTIYRIAHELHARGVPLMPRIMTEHAHTITGTDIHPGATIGRRFFIDHATGVVIGETTSIGDNVKVYQGVTLGALSIPKDERGRAIKGQKRHPTIEDDVTIYANATILGGQTVIGRGVTVGGNTFVTKSVMADTTVTGEKPKLRVRPTAGAGDTGKPGGK